MEGFEGQQEWSEELPEGSVALQRGLRAWQRGLRAWQRGQRVCQRGPMACQRGPRALKRGLGAWQGVRGDGCMDGQMEFLPILQDFVPYRGRCQKKRRKVAFGPLSIQDQQKACCLFKSFFVADNESVINCKVV